jgi:hypothetical protein
MVAREHTASHSNWHMQDALHKPVELAEEYPLSSMLVVFGAGIGVGLLLSQALAGPLSHWMEPEPTMSERLGRQMLDYMRSVVPESVQRQFRG